MITTYQIAKNTLLGVSRDAKSLHRDDIPLIRQIINDSCHDINRDLNLSEYQFDLLCRYACKLHPKR